MACPECGATPLDRARAMVRSEERVSTLRVLGALSVAWALGGLCFIEIWMVTYPIGVLLTLVGLGLAARSGRLTKHITLWVGLILNCFGVVAFLAIMFGW